MTLSSDQIAAALTTAGGMLETVEVPLGDHKVRDWKNSPPSIAAIVEGSRANGDKTYLVYEGERLSFTEHYARVAALGNALVDRFGIRPGDRVAIAMRNLPEWSIAFWAATAIGAIAVPLNAWWTAEELRYGLADSAARVVVADPERFARIAEVREGLPLDAVIVARATAALPAGALAFEEVVGTIDPALRLPQVAIAPDDPATIFYTSGSTGSPKGALGTHRNFCSCIFTGAYLGAWMGLRAGLSFEQLAAQQTLMRERLNATLLTVPLFHVSGCIMTLMLNLAFGGKTVMMRKWDADEAVRLIEREQVSAFVGVPTMVWHLLDSPELKGRDLSSLTSISFGGAPAPAELRRRLSEAFPNVTGVTTGYGLTECSATVTSIGGPDYVARPESVGVPPPVIELEVVDDDGGVVGTGELGEIRIRGPNVVRGYWNKPEASAEAFAEGWFRTGDIGRVDADGFVYLVDRKKDMIIRGGENVYCSEVESALVAQPGVKAACVFGVPHPTLGEEVGAAIQVDPAVAPDDAALTDALRGRIAGFKVPTRIWRQTESLPLGATGKIAKREIRAALLRDQVPA